MVEGDILVGEVAPNLCVIYISLNWLLKRLSETAHRCVIDFIEFSRPIMIISSHVKAFRNAGYKYIIYLFEYTYVCLHSVLGNSSYFYA